MKIKEVCKLTDLTERTVRFYVEEKLINPKSTLKNGREYFDYSEQDIAELITIADLRKLFFSISEIKEMKESPTRIIDVVTAYKNKLNTEATAKATIVQTLERLSVSSFRNIDSLAISLKNVSASLQLPSHDSNPNFGRFDRETKEDREREFEQFEVRQQRQYRLGQIIVYSIASIHVISTIVSAFISFNFISFIIQFVLVIALFAGVTWVRYLFAVGAVLSILMGCTLLASGYVSQLSTGFVWILVIQMFYSAGASVLLLAHSGVKEFLYEQKNG